MTPKNRPTDNSLSAIVGRFFWQGCDGGRCRLAAEAGVTMIEVLVVVALIAFIYTIALPQFNMKSGTEVATKTQRLADDIRSAFDMAVLNNRTYRIVFHLASGKYHLESADRTVLLEKSSAGHDPTDEEVKAKIEEFAEQTKEYERMADEPVKDDKGDVIPGSNTSPLLRFRNNAAPVQWEKVENLEWNDRSLGDFLLISEMQAEHHGQKQILSELGPNGRAFLYFYPQGYVERAYIRVALKREEGVVDETEQPFTITTKPFTGGADVESGAIEVDMSEDGKDENDGD